MEDILSGDEEEADEGEGLQTLLKQLQQLTGHLLAARATAGMRTVYDNLWWPAKSVCSKDCIEVLSILDDHCSTCVRSQVPCSWCHWSSFCG